MLLGKSKWRWHTEKIEQFQARIEKKPHQDDYMFGMRQLKGLKLSQIILKYDKILKYKKVNENKESSFSTENLGNMSKMAILANLGF